VSELINIGPINAGSMNAGAGLDFEGWTCPLPLRDSPNIVMGHGGGGQMSAELIDHLFIPALGGQGAPKPTLLFSSWAEYGWPSPPTRSSYDRCFSRAGQSAIWPSTAPSMIWP
jgi:hypothetical protein